MSPIDKKGRTIHAGKSEKKKKIYSTIGKDIFFWLVVERGE